MTIILNPANTYPPKTNPANADPIKQQTAAVISALDSALSPYGWNAKWQQAYEHFIEAHPQPPSAPGPQALFQPARLLVDHGSRFLVRTPLGESWMQRPLDGALTLAVGDWVVCTRDPFDDETVHFKGLLPRATKFSRAAAGSKVKEQILAANIDTVFLVQSLNHDFNLRRLQRYLIAAWESGARPVVVLTKADLITMEAHLDEKLQAVEGVAIGVPIVPVSALTHKGLEALNPYLGMGTTVALLGSSGVGKSTLINTLIGQERLATQDIRTDDSKGRHTTTHRELVILEGGAVLVDTPGMRSFALWDAEEGIAQVFGDVEALMAQCQFKDCDHRRTSGCAVQRALTEGQLPYGHYESWQKLQKEQRLLESKLKRKEKALDKQQAAWKQKKPQRSDIIKRALSEY